jgi:hypothetical protein
MEKYSEAFIAFDTAKNKHAVAIADVGRLDEVSPDISVRPEGAYHQWREVPPRQLSV